jgi:hypothetical protein
MQASPHGDQLKVRKSLDIEAMSARHHQITIIGFDRADCQEIAKGLKELSVTR